MGGESTDSSRFHADRTLILRRRENGSPCGEITVRGLLSTFG